MHLAVATIHSLCEGHVSGMCGRSQPFTACRVLLSLMLSATAQVRAPGIVQIGICVVDQTVSCLTQRWCLALLCDCGVPVCVGSFALALTPQLEAGVA